VVQALKNNRDHREIEVIGINSEELNILRTEVDKFLIAPSIADPTYTDWLEGVCRSESIDIVFPFFQLELPLAVQYRPRLEAIGTRVSITSAESLALVNDKIKMARQYPRFMPRQAVVKNSTDVRAFAHLIGYYAHRDGVTGGMPMCCKLAGCSAGYGFAVIDELKSLDMYLLNKAKRYISLDQLCKMVDHGWLKRIPHEVILQEYVEGTEYCVCVLAANGTVAGMCGFMGDSIEGGAYTSGMILKNEAAYAIAREVVEDSGLDGNACFDFIIRPDGRPVLLECNPRLSAGIAFPEAAGADFVYQRCRQLMGEDFAREYDIDYGLKMMRYPDYHFFK